MMNTKRNRTASRINVAAASLGMMTLMPGCGGEDPYTTSESIEPVEQLSETKETTENVEDVGSLDHVASVRQAASNPVECTFELATCVAESWWISEIIACNEAYSTCLAEGLIPPEITETADALRECRETLGVCRSEASTPAGLVSCRVESVRCGADALLTPVTDIVDDAVACVDAASTCTSEATTLPELRECRREFGACAAQAAIDALPIPPFVQETIDEVGVCADGLRTCVQEAEAPSDVAACNRTNVLCVADAIGVPVPDPGPVATCAEIGVSCVREARSAEDLSMCRDRFGACLNELAPDSRVNCDIAFTQCVARNPFAFFQCAIAARQCRLDRL